VHEVRHRADLRLSKIDFPFAGFSHRQISPTQDFTLPPPRPGLRFAARAVFSSSSIRSARSQKFGLPEPLRNPSRLHEQMIAQPVHVDDEVVADVFLALQPPAYALRTPAHRARL